MAKRSRKLYNWKDFLPRGGNKRELARWLITGDSQYSKHEMAQQNLSSLARMLILLREYEQHFGIPTFGGPDVQRRVLRDITNSLYSSGAPTWVLEAVMERVAEGMTGKEGVQFMLLPNHGLIYHPRTPSMSATTDLFKATSGYDISKFNAVEQVAVRLASFASNTKSAERLTAASITTPRKQELEKVVKQQHQSLNETWTSPLELEEEILSLAWSTYGLFYFFNNEEELLQQAIAPTATSVHRDQSLSFWEVTNTTREIFTRLATHEASMAMTKVQQDEGTRQQLYPPRVLSIFRIWSSMGACTLWFGGSFADMLVSGALAVAIASIYTSRKSSLAFEETVLTDVVSSFLVGLCAGMLAIHWPRRFCFGAIAVASVMDLMQGFKVVYAVLEVMSKNIVTGTSRLLEGILFTGLISYSLKFGLVFAYRMAKGPTSLLSLKDYSSMLIPHPSGMIDQRFYPLILPFAATAWSGLLRPSYADLPAMVFHTVLAFCLTWAGTPLYVAAACATFSAGIVSRFTGKHALGNTLAGLYALVPGTYMVQALLSAPTSRSGFIDTVLQLSVTIGLGGFAGAILCSPTIVGKSSGFMGSRARTTTATGKHKRSGIMLPAALRRQR